MAMKTFRTQKQRHIFPIRQRLSAWILILYRLSLIGEHSQLMDIRCYYLKIEMANYLME